MAEKQKTNWITKSDWYKKPLTRMGGTALILISIFGAGFAAGERIQENKENLEKFKLNQEWNEKLEQEQEKYRQLFLQVYGKKVDDIQTVVDALRKMKHEK